MKTTLKIASAAFALLFMVALAPQAFADGKKTEKTQISAKVDCNGCKTKIEHHMAFENGVKDVVADVETKIVTIEFDPSKTNPEKLAAEITKIGYEGKVMKGDCKDSKKECESKCHDKKGEAKTTCKSKCESSCKGESKDHKCCDKK